MGSFPGKFISGISGLDFSDRFGPYGLVVVTRNISKTAVKIL